MQFKTILVVAMLCLAMAGVAAAEDDVKCCWEKPCGTPVEQCDKETTFVLYDSDARIVTTIHGYVYVDMAPDTNGQGQEIITAGDIRLSNWHTNYDPNTKVMPEDMDNLDVIETVHAAPIKYVDVNDNQKYDLYDGVVYDLDNDNMVSVGDILQTDLPAVDVYSLEESNAGEFVMAQGAMGSAWDRVTASHPAYGMATEGTIGTGVANELIKWVDADDSNDWSCSDKLYLIQPHCEAEVLDHAVTIGDTRVYIPADDPCIPDCGTKVVQGDHDATYMLMKNLNAQLAYYTFGGETEWYVDMDSDNFVSFGDIRLTEVSTHYGPNTKVKVCDEFDLGHDLTPSDQTLVRYAETDGLAGYTLGDRVYVDVQDNDVVDAGDIRLVEAEVYLPGFVDPFVYAEWSVVESNDADAGDDLRGLGPGNTYLPLNDLLGYIDSDCTGDWTCPDKLYVQQLTGEHHKDVAVTIGDLRLYVPVNDPNSPFFGMEEWPNCGTKVDCGDIDLEYKVSELFTDYAWIKFVDRDGDGVFTEGTDHAYIDMDNSNDVTLYDVRLTDVTIKMAFYPNNTKVMDQHALDLGDTLIPADDNLKMADEDLLGVIPYVSSPGVFTVYHFDNDCSGDWTCVDALYLKMIDSFQADNYAVTHGDIRLFIPPELICEANGETPVDCPYDLTAPFGVINPGDVNAVIDAVVLGTPGYEPIDVNNVIDMLILGTYCE